MLNADARVTKYIAKEDGRNAGKQRCLGPGTSINSVVNLTYPPKHSTSQSW